LRPGEVVVEVVVQSESERKIP